MRLDFASLNAGRKDWLELNPGRDSGPGPRLPSGGGASATASQGVQEAGGEAPGAEDFNFNPDSNNRLYYLNDPLFYEVVIKKEEAPYEFKIHLFLDGDNSSSTRESPHK